jgi:hypothetical protein
MFKNNINQERFKLFILIFLTNFSLNLLAGFQFQKTLLIGLSVYLLIYPFVTIICRLLLYFFENHDWSEAFLDCAELSLGPEQVNYTRLLERFLKDSKDALRWVMWANKSSFQLIIFLSSLMFIFNIACNPMSLIFDALLNSIEGAWILPEVYEYVLKNPIKVILVCFYFIVVCSLLILHHYPTKNRYDFFICIIIITLLVIFSFLTISKWLCFFF